MPIRFNLYNTTDPRKLYELKRREAEAMLEVVRAMDVETPPEELIFLVITAIRQQLDVYKLMLVFAEPERQSGASTKRIAVNYGFRTPSETALARLDECVNIRELAHSPFPEMREMGVEYVIPVGTPGQLRAWFLIADFAESEDETVNDIIFIETVGNILTMSLQNIRLFEEKLSAERLRREIELAGDIQNQALPKNFDLHPALDIHAHSVPHSNVAGDFYNLIPMGESEIVVFMADAAGKGIAAAILITNIQATLNALLLDGASFSTVLRRLHQVIGRLTHYEKFVTLFLGKIDLARGQLTYVNAGHNPPLLLRANRQREWLRKGCIPLGIMEVKQFEQGTVAFCPGDLLYLYSDGLVEQPAPSGEMFGEERLERLMLSSSHQNANKLLNATLRAIAAHAAGNDYEDDISLMAIRYVNAV